jgi:hypothetical protein
MLALRKAVATFKQLEAVAGAPRVRLLPAPEPNRADHPYVGTIVYQGLLIYVENTKGSTRSGTAPDGTRWSVRMPAHYGEFAGTLGMDGDPVDVFVGDDPDAPDAFVVHQKVPGTQRPDEDKVILGVRTAAAAKALFMTAYTKPGFFGGMTRWSLADLRAHLLEGRAPGTRLDLPPHLQAMVKAARSSWMLRALLKNAQLILFGGAALAKHTKVVTVRGHVRRDGSVVQSHVRHVLVDDEVEQEEPPPPAVPKPPTLDALRTDLARLVDELMPDVTRTDPHGFDAQGLAEIRADSDARVASVWEGALPPHLRDQSAPPKDVLGWGFDIAVAQQEERLAMHAHPWREAQRQPEHQRMSGVVDDLIRAGSDATLEGSSLDRTVNYSGHLANNLERIAGASGWADAIEIMKRQHGSASVNMSAIKAKARAEAVAQVKAAEEAGTRRFWSEADRKAAVVTEMERVLRDSWSQTVKALPSMVRRYRAASRVGALIASPPAALVERAGRGHPSGWTAEEFGREHAVEIGYQLRNHASDNYKVWLEQSQRNEDYDSGRYRQRRADYLAGINMPHWGSATSDNETGRMTSVYGDHGMYRPLDRAMTPHQVVTEGVDQGTQLTLTPMQRLTGLSRAVKARKGMARFPRSDHPTVFRGMALPLPVLEAAVAHGHVPLTGCTAFSFDRSVAEHYSSSSWTKDKSGPGPTVPVIIHMERNQDFDDSVAGWNPKTRDGENRPAFEIVSGIAGMRVKHAERRDNGTWVLHVEGVP